MKLRQGFVSNSSSSSFIIALKDKPQSAEELQKILFGDSEILAYYDCSMTTSLAAETVLEDIKEPVGLKEIIEELDCGWPEVDDEDKRPEYPWSELNDTIEKKKQSYEKYQGECLVYNTKIAESFMKKTEGMKYYIVEYCDNDGAHQSALEHGGTFDNIPHLRVSKH